MRIGWSTSRCLPRACECVCRSLCWSVYIYIYMCMFVCICLCMFLYACGCEHVVSICVCVLWQYVSVMRFNPGFGFVVVDVLNLKQIPDPCSQIRYLSVVRDVGAATAYAAARRAASAHVQSITTARIATATTSARRRRSCGRRRGTGHPTHGHCRRFACLSL